MRRIVGYWVLFLVTAIVYGAMIFWSLPLLRGPMGEMPFDLRPRGYEFSQAQSYLASLTPDQIEFYLWTQQFLDFAYPALMAALVIWTSLWATKGKHWSLRYIAGFFAVIAMVFDYLENLVVRMMLQSDPLDLSPDRVWMASTMTELKSAFGALAYSILVVLLFRVAWAQVRRMRVES